MLALTGSVSSVESITLGGQDQEAALGGIIEETFRPFSGARVGLHPEESVPLALGSLTLLLLLLPALPVRLARVGGATVQCLACLQLSAIMAALSLYNISLAIFIAIPLVPLAILASQFSRWSIPRVILR